jgi:hypothetical protein
VTMAGQDSSERRGAKLLTLQTAAATALAAPLGGVTQVWGGHDHLARATSDPAAVLAHDLVLVFLATVAATTLALPAAVAWARLPRPGTGRLVTFAGLALAVTLPAAAVLAWGFLFPGARLVLLAVLVVAGLLGLLAVVGFVGTLAARGSRYLRHRRRSSRSRHEAWTRARRADGGSPALAADDAGPDWPALFWNHWLVAALVVGLVAGGVLGAPLGGAVETWSGGSPLAAFDYETTETADGTRLTVVHDGGDAIPADELRLQGGLTAVPGANQTRAGPWNGPTTHLGDGRQPGPHVAPGDAVAVGVPDDCTVRVVWENPAGASVTLGKYDCGEDGAR